MPYPQFTDVPVRCWRHLGPLGTREPCVCLEHRRLEEGAPILAALRELSAADGPTQLVLTFASREPGALRALRLQHVEPSADLRVMHIGCDGDIVTIEATAAGFELLVKAVGLWLTGGEDFGVHPRQAGLRRDEYGTRDRDSGELWFWGPTMVP